MILRISMEVSIEGKGEVRSHALDVSADCSFDGLN